MSADHTTYIECG